MNDEQFDKELSALYQQRKSTIVAPNVILANNSVRNRNSVIKLLSIFTVGGVASFGIMAVMSYFSTTQVGEEQVYNTQYQVSIVDNISKVVDDKTVTIKPKLPPKPETQLLDEQVDILVPVKESTQASDVENIKTSQVKIVQLPNLTEPVFLIKPVYKVMPEYSQRSMQNKQSGMIKLRYDIDATGSVKNIEVVNSEVNRELQRSAKKALAKWKYNPTDNDEQGYEIIFEFNSKD